MNKIINNLSIKKPLCREFILSQNNYCSSNRPRGGWCNNDEILYRNTCQLPQIYEKK